MVTLPVMSGPQRDVAFCRQARIALPAATLLGYVSLTSAQTVPQLTPTTATGIGVWYQSDAPARKALWQAGDPGERLRLTVRVRDTSGAPVANAQVELWQANGDGVVQADRYRTRLRTSADGSVAVDTVLPGYIWRARHIHLVVTHPDHQRLVTRILFRGDPLLVEMEYPELAISLEQGNAGDEPMLFGTAEIVLQY